METNNYDGHYQVSEADQFSSLNHRGEPEDTVEREDTVGEEKNVKAGESGEGKITKQIEQVTTKIPSGTFLSAALGSIAISALFQVIGRKADAQFIGQWVPTILILGLYNKLVKLEGSE